MYSAKAFYKNVWDRVEGRVPLPTGISHPTHTSNVCMASKFLPGTRCKIRGIYTGSAQWEAAKVISSIFVAFPSGTRVRQAIVFHKGREVAVYPRWGEIWLEGEKEPAIEKEQEWWDDFVLNRVVFTLSVDETDAESYENVFKAKKCTSVGINGKVVTMILIPVLFMSSNPTGKSCFVEHPNAGQRDPEDVQTRRIMTTMQHYLRFYGKNEGYAPSIKPRFRSGSTSSTDTACTSSSRFSDTACSVSTWSGETVRSSSTWSGETVCSSPTWSGRTICASPTWSGDSDTLDGWSVYFSDSE